LGVISITLKPLIRLELTYMMLNPQPVRHHGDEFRIGRLGFAVADRITE
jgi:hypothetical protein